MLILVSLYLINTSIFFGTPKKKKSFFPWTFSILPPIPRQHRTAVGRLENKSELWRPFLAAIGWRGMCCSVLLIYIFFYRTYEHQLMEQGLCKAFVQNLSLRIFACVFYTNLPGRKVLVGHRDPEQPMESDRRRQPDRWPLITNKCSDRSGL